MKLREADWLALLLVAICLILGVASHNALNPDGVAYLDLAERLRDGDWSHFVQGYWSPLYPVLIAVAAVLTGREGPALIGLVHLLNTLIAIFGVAVIWRMARRSNNQYFCRGAFAALLVSSAEAPRLEAVTPDLLLVAMVALIGDELLFFGGKRWLRLGVWLGLAFLAKTSMWPWLLVATIVRLVLPGGRIGRGAAAKSATVCAGLMLLWLVPMSSRYGGPTFGSSAPLNACWYMRECDTRSPDTHSGEHRLYRVITTGASQATVAAIGGTPWTYLPWSDPTAWSEGLITARRVTPDLPQHLLYAAKQFLMVVGVWMPHVWLGILLPVAWITRRRGRWRELRGASRDAGMVMFLGTLGILQFVVVHVEPRLVAPFVLLFALGALAWLAGVPTSAGDQPAGPAMPRKLVLALSWLGLVAALPRSVIHAADQWTTARLTEERRAMITTAEAAQNPPRTGPRRIAVIGKVFPILTEAYRLGGKIEWQVFRPTVPAILDWPAQDQQALVGWLAAQGATEAWLSKPGGSFSILPLTPQ